MWLEQDLYDMIVPRHPTNNGFGDAMDFIENYLAQKDLGEPDDFRLIWQPRIRNSPESYVLEYSWFLQKGDVNRSLDLTVTINIDEETFIYHANESIEGGTMILEVELET